MEHGNTFDPQYYWEQRLSAHRDITGVGYLGLSPKLVEYQYRSRMRQVDLILRLHGLTDLTGRTVLDVGAGTGIWLDFWHRYGASHVAGLDFTSISVDTLRERFPDDMIIQADVSDAPLPMPDDMYFDIISAFDVLLHIVHPDRFHRAIANLARHCKPNGWLITSDPIQCGLGYVPRRSYGIHNKVRSMSEYRLALEMHGFIIDSILPATVLLNTPLEASNPYVFAILE